MKATKKFVSLMLAVIMTALAFIIPVSASGATPLVMVNGLGSTTLYKDFGTDNQKEVFSDDEEFLKPMIKDVIKAFADGWIRYGVDRKNWDSFADGFFPVVNKYINDIGYNTDGTPRNPSVGFFRYAKPLSEYTEEEKRDIGIFNYEYAKKYGADKSYNFSYDWREDPIKIAAELNNFIRDVKAQTGAKRVNVVALSMGSSVLLAYMNKYGGSSLNNVVFVSPAWQGTSVAGNIATNNVELDIFATENYLVQLANVSMTSHLAAFIISTIASQQGLSHEYFGDINKVLQGILPRAYTDTIVPYIAGMPGFWGLIPADYYEDAKAFLFGDSIDPAFEAKIDAYHKIQVNAKSIVTKSMKKGADKKSMHFGIVCGYNCQITPVSTEYYSSDSIIDTKYMSGGAKCAKYLQAHDDWGKLYTQQIKDGHNHMSWDSKIDASTAMFPEYTWFIKNMQHTNFTETNGTLAVPMWLLGATKQYTVHTDKVHYPQFFLYNTYAWKSKPMPADGKLGDLDNSSMPTTLDARLALKIAAGQVKPTDTQLALGDINEDGKITTEDARRILCLAAGVAFK